MMEAIKSRTTISSPRENLSQISYPRFRSGARVQ